VNKSLAPASLLINAGAICHISYRTQRSKKGKLFIVDNYLEAVGVMNAIKSGISVDAVRRPIAYTNYIADTSVDNSYKQAEANENISTEKILKKRIS